MTTYYLDFEGGTDGNTGLSFAQRRKTLGAFSAADLAPGDTVRIMASPAVTSLGQNATFTNLSPTVTLTSAVTANISLCGAAWTASANVTTTTSSTRKEGTLSTSIAPAAAFTTGLAAYEATGALDLSSYQQVSFWIQQTSGTVAIAGDVSLRLCSDTLGAVSVQTIAIPALLATNGWQSVTVDVGGALPAVVNSVALYVDTDRGAQTFLIDNIIACKASGSADALTLNSLIGKNADDGLWWPIRSINGTTVTIDDGINSSNATTARGYVGTTATVAAYKREPSRPAPTNSNFAVVNDSGSSGSPITISGGWSRVDMATQTDETWVSNAFGGSSVGLSIATRSFITAEKMSFVRYATGISISTGVNQTFGSTCNVLGCTTGLSITGTPVAEQTTPLSFGYSYCNTGTCIVESGTDCMGRLFGTIQGVLSCSSNGQGFSINGTANGTVVQNLLVVKNCGSSGIYLASMNARINVGTVSGNGNGILFVAAAFGCKISNGTFSSNTVDVNISSNVVNGYHDLFNCSLGSATEFGTFGAPGKGGRIRSTKHDATANTHYILDHLGVIQSESTVRHTASGISWKMSPTTAVATVDAPLTLPIARVACAASLLVTVKAWMRRTNTALTLKLVCKGNQIGGVSSDVSSSVTVAADTWEEVTITFTPNEAGVVEIEAQASGGTTYSGYIDDMTITQA